MKNKYLLFIITVISSPVLMHAQDDCLSIPQLERILEVEISEVPNFVERKSYGSGNEILIIGSDTILTNYYSWSSGNKSLRIHKSEDGLARLIIYSDPTCTYSFAEKAMSAGYLTQDKALPFLFKKGNLELILRRNGQVLLFGTDFRLKLLAIRNAHKARKEIARRTEEKLISSQREIEDLLKNEDYSNAFKEYENLCGGNLNEVSKCENLEKLILTSWEKKVTNEIDGLIRGNKFSVAENYLSTSNFPIDSLISHWGGLIVSKRNKHETQILYTQLENAVKGENHSSQLEIANKILAYPDVHNLIKIEAERIKKKSENMIELLNIRKSTTLDYWKYSPGTKENITKLIYNYIRKQVKSKKEGELTIDFNIKFDTLGNNLSVNKSIGPNKQFLDQILNQLQPLKRSNYFFTSEASVAFHVTWEATSLKVQSDIHGMDFSHSTIWKEDITQLVKYAPLPYGSFTFMEKSVKINSKLYSQIHFENHNSGSGGFKNIFKSLIVPGLGRKGVQYGKPNSRWQLPVIMFSAALGSEVYAQMLLSEFREDPTQTAIYDEANTWHQIGLVSAGIGVIDYLYEQFYVMSKSFSNSKKSSSNRKYGIPWTRDNFKF